MRMRGRKWMASHMEEVEGAVEVEGEESSRRALAQSNLVMWGQMGSKFSG